MAEIIEKCGCRYHSEDRNTAHGGGPHVHSDKCTEGHIGDDQQAEYLARLLDELRYYIDTARDAAPLYSVSGINEVYETDDARAATAYLQIGWKMLWAGMKGRQFGMVLSWDWGAPVKHPDPNTWIPTITQS